jgi:phosphatidylinositol alpha-mannosyltransferase
MRVALTHAYSWPEVRRGAERIIVALSAALAERGHDVTVFTAGRRPGRHRDAAGVRWVRLRRVFGDPLRHERDFGLRLLPHLLRGRFDAVHSLGPRDAVAALRARRLGARHRTVYTNLGIPVRSWWEARPDGRAQARVVREIDVYGCMSRYALDVLAADYGRTGALTPGGVDLEAFRPAPAREPRPTVLFSGALAEPHKGVATLLAAVPELAAAEPDVQVWLSGPGDAAPLLAAAPPEARERTRLLPLGDPDRQHERYGRAWVTTLPSRGDSFGMVMVESLACGTPIVPANDSALPELVAPGVTGALCEPDDPHSLAQALLAAIALARRPETAAACRAAAEPFDWRRAVAPLCERLYAGG